jgi:sulfate adenylyltransferase subunit 2
MTVAVPQSPADAARIADPSDPRAHPRENSHDDAHLTRLEAEAVSIIREAAGALERSALLFSGGKDSAVLLHLSRKAFAPGPIPFPLLHIDTGHNFDETLVFRDRAAAAAGARLVVRTVEDAIARGIAAEDPGPTPSRNRAQSPTLLDAIQALELQALFGGGRRDEEKSRAKERVFSVRDEFGQWDPRNQRPELWRHYNTTIRRGHHLRVFPISDWTELDVWRYIERERIELPTLYFAHEREVIVRKDRLVPVSAFTPASPGERVERALVRFRTVGDLTCTAAVRSGARTVREIIDEVAAATTSERGTRLDDKTSDAAMEDRKKEGYF